MALIARLPAGDAAHAAARALEQLLGHDVILTVGDPLVAEPSPELLPHGETRAVALPFGDGVLGEVTLVVVVQFATSMEAATPSASLVTAAVPALQAAAEAMVSAVAMHPNPAHAGEIETDTLLLAIEGDFVIVPILENDEYLAGVVVRVVDDEPDAPPVARLVNTPPGELRPPEPRAIAPAFHPSVSYDAPAPFDAPVSGVVKSVTRYEFQPLGDGNGMTGPARPLSLLNDVQMELTAELGRRRMKVRDIVALEPGSVIELDRAAGSPVDVLVNGALIAHGEVVVIDEEFGIRVSEIVLGDS
jgi:flagellar motor switch protein FliN/FliY